jgi:hypothetical protein
MTRFHGLLAPQWMQVLQYGITHQEVMTHIDVADGNSAPEQNRVRATGAELSPNF